MLNIKNPTVGQLIYMKDLYSKEVLLQYMHNKWSHKFNKSLTPKDSDQFRKEVEYLGLRTIEVLAIAFSNHCCCLGDKF